ncbi:MAG: methyltransferase [Treponemataceae bacterium]|nr:MAG: methyltransferase [Treponemataceae bacterium]
MSLPKNIDYTSDRIRAVDAKFEAQRIAFSPLTFQAIYSLRELGALQYVSDAGDDGVTLDEIAQKCGISLYGAGVLAEMALGMRVFRIAHNATESGNAPEKFVLGKVGWFLLEDELTRVNFNFTNDVCYKGAFDLLQSIRDGKPCGLSVFDVPNRKKWTTVYEALSTLPEHIKTSWFDFDHFYSDVAFPEALPIVFAEKPMHLIDIGGNTAKWAIACCRYNPSVQVTIVDLPGQTAVAEHNAKEAGFSQRITTAASNVLDSTTALNTSGGKPDAVWMSQFLDCFSLSQITLILEKVYAAASAETDVWVLEPLWDMQKYEAASYALQATSLYFTCIANGNSKMYRFDELKDAIEKAGFELRTAHHSLGSNCYSLLRFRKV